MTFTELEEEARQSAARLLRAGVPAEEIASIEGAEIRPHRRAALRELLARLNQQVRAVEVELWTLVAVRVAASVGTSSTRVETAGAVDVKVTVTLPDGRRTVEGEVTLIPSQDDDDGELSAWGQPDDWVDSGLLSALRALPADEYRTALYVLEAAAREAQL